MTDTEALKIAAEAAAIALPDDAPEGVRARFGALVYLAERVSALASEGRVADLEHRVGELTEEAKRLGDVDTEARRLRLEMFDIECAAKKAGLDHLAKMAQTARLGAAAAASINGGRP